MNLEVILHDHVYRPMGALRIESDGGKINGLIELDWDLSKIHENSAP